MVLSSPSDALPLPLAVFATRSLRQAPVDEYNYGALLNSSHDFYRSQWVGSLPSQDVPSWRGNAFTNEIGPAKLNWGGITGGIMEGADAGRQTSSQSPEEVVPFEVLLVACWGGYLFSVVLP